VAYLQSESNDAENDTEPEGHLSERRTVSQMAKDDKDNAERYQDLPWLDRT
jgi:hypothetical protein